VLAGLHVGALAFALYWQDAGCGCRECGQLLFTITLLSAYVAVVEQTRPVLRAAMMAAIVVFGGFFFRRLELLNSAAVAGSNSARCKTARFERLQLSIDLRRHRMHCGLALPWLGEDGAAVCALAARLARRNTRCRS